MGLLNIMKDARSPCPSTFGKQIFKHLNYLKSKNKLEDFQFHRNPAGIFSFPASLASPIIGEYYDEVNSAQLDQEDLNVTEELCLSMMGTFQNESDRLLRASEILQGYFEHALSQITFQSTATTSITTDGSYIIYLPTLNQSAMIFNRKDKNEMGKTDASAFEECLWYHFQWLCSTSNKLLDRSCCPAILASLVGPYLSFSVGFQCGGRYVADPVTPFLQLMMLPYQQEAMIKVAQALRATKNAIDKLIPQYHVWDRMSEVEVSKVQLHCPYPRSFRVQGDSFEFTYLHPIHPNEQDKDNDNNRNNNYHHLLFLVEITQSSNPSLFNVQQQVVVKFTKNYYGTEVHAGLASIGLAPALFAVVELAGGWKMIVMENISWPSLFYCSFDDEINAKILINVKRALDYLSSHSLAHGDLRTINILANSDGDIRIVDFDSSGSTTGTSPARYPPFLNVSGRIPWHPGVTRGGLMETSHDHYLYKSIFPGLPLP